MSLYRFFYIMPDGEYRESFIMVQAETVYHAAQQFNRPHMLFGDAIGFMVEPAPGIDPKNSYYRSRLIKTWMPNR